MRIREAREDDIEEIRRINEEAFSKIPSVGFDGMWSKKDLEEFLTHDDFRVLVAEQDGRIVGFTIFRIKNINRRFRFDKLENPPIEDWESCAYLMYVAVDPKYQGQGIGKKLLQAVIEETKRLGKRCLFGEFTTANPAAIKLAEDFGGKELCADVWYKFDL